MRLRYLFRVYKILSSPRIISVAPHGATMHPTVVLGSRPAPNVFHSASQATAGSEQSGHAVAGGAARAQEL